MSKSKIIVFISLFFVSCAACESGNSKEQEAGTAEHNLIQDPSFKKGISLAGVNSSNPKTKHIIYPFSTSDYNPVWRLAEWGSKYSLNDSVSTITENGVTYSNIAKSVSFKDLGETTQVTLEVYGSKEYSLPRQAGEDWPHVLLEQQFESPQALKDISSLIFNLDFRLLFSEMKMNSEEFDPSLHTTQVTIYLTLVNMNKQSEGYGDFIWFGLPIYDYRFDVIDEYAAKDSGKEDASNKFIYSVGSKPLFSEIPKDGNWISISRDIIDLMELAFSTAQKRGFIQNSEHSDMYITSTNMGWETQGTFDCGIQYKNLSLQASTAE